MPQRSRCERGVIERLEAHEEGQAETPVVDSSSFLLDISLLLLPAAVKTGLFRRIHD